MQLSLPQPFPNPQPSPPQQLSSSRIQIMEQQEFPPKRLVFLAPPQSLSHPHPQFVALMSLMFGSSK